MYISFPDRVRKVLEAVMDLSLFASSVVGFVCLMLDLGWNLSQDYRFWALGVTQFVLWLFVAQEALRPLMAINFKDYLRSRWVEVLLAVVFAAELVAANFYGEWFLIKLAEWFPNMHPLRLMLMGISGVGAVGGFLYFLRSARTSKRLSLRHVSPGWMMIVGFVGLSTTGALLLMMPNCQAVPVRWIDCWFVATSASCVTGLATVNTALTWTPLGQAIILILIQLGGLGVMTFTYFIAYFLSGGLSLSDRVVLRDLLNEDNIGFIGQMLLMIGGATFAIEAVGVAWMYVSLDHFPEYENHALYFSVFHAVSAFCNAGFTLFPDDVHHSGLLASVSSQFCIMTMIVMGGIGFPVLKNTAEVVWSRVTRVVLRRQTAYRHLNVHTRIVLWVTAFLIVAGAVGFLVCDLHYGTQEQVSAWRAALFNSITCRTAGFMIDDIAKWSMPAAMLGILLMFIGGSPGGTAGGVRTTTVAVAGMNIWQMVRGKQRMELGNRSFGPELAQKAFAIITLSATFVLAVTVLLVIWHPGIPPINLLFEAVSAFSTTGASRGVSPNLTDAGKVAIIISMLVGRIGILVVAFSLIPKARPGRVKLPDGTILLS